MDRRQRDRRLCLAGTGPAPDPDEGPESILVGYLPPNTFIRLRDRIAVLARERRLRAVTRTNADEGT